METGIIKRKADDALQVVNGLVEVLSEYDVKPGNFCITGSYALTALGLQLDRPLNDVDLYLELDPKDPDQKYKEVIKRLAAMQYASGYTSPYNKDESNNNDESNVIIALDFRGMKVNLFITFNHNFWFRVIQTMNGYNIDTIDHVLSRKMALKRPKDYKDLNTIIKNLLSL